MLLFVSWCELWCHFIVVRYKPWRRNRTSKLFVDQQLDPSVKLFGSRGSHSYFQLNQPRIGSLRLVQNRFLILSVDSGIEIDSIDRFWNRPVQRIQSDFDACRRKCWFSTRIEEGVLRFYHPDGCDFNLVDLKWGVTQCGTIGMALLF